MIFKALSAAEWAIHTQALHAESLWNNPEYLSAVALISECKVAYYGLEINGEIKIGVSIFTKNKKIFLPFHFTFTGIIADKNISAEHAFELWSYFISEINKLYSTVILHLPYSMKDIRAFRANGYTSTPMYSYIVDKNSTWEPNLNKKLRKAQDTNYILETNQNLPQSIIAHLNTFTNIGVPKHKALEWNKFIQMMEAKSFAHNYTISHDGALLASQIMLKDASTRKAYCICLSQSADKLAHVPLHQYFINTLTSQDYTIDFMGADIQSISRFKAGFGGEMDFYFIVKKSAAGKLIEMLKKWVKKMI